MKKVNLILFYCLLFLYSCTETPVIVYIEPEGETVTKGYGKKFIGSTYFTRVSVGICGEVWLLKGKSDQCSVTISAPENYHDYIKAKVKNGRLTVDYKFENITTDPELTKIIIIAPEFKRMVFTNVADVSTHELSTKELEIIHSGVGNINFSGVKVNSLYLEHSGVGDVNLSGEAKNTEIDFSGIGTLHAFEFETRFMDAVISGQARVYVNVSESLNAEVGGTTLFSCKGNAPIKNIRRTGKARIFDVQN